VEGGCSRRRPAVQLAEDAHLWVDGELVPLSNGARSVALVFRDVLAEGNADV